MNRPPVEFRQLTVGPASGRLHLATPLRSLTLCGLQLPIVVPGTPTREDLTRTCTECAGAYARSCRMPKPRRPHKPVDRRWEKTLDQHIEVMGLPTPLHEHRFHPTRMWRFDRAWPAYHLAMEIDGAVGFGRHSRRYGQAEDYVKLVHAQLLGWDVIRVTSGQVQSGHAVRWLKAAILVRLGKLEPAAAAVQADLMPPPPPRKAKEPAP